MHEEIMDVQVPVLLKLPRILHCGLDIKRDEGD